jgi:6-pyruvoyl-tetrahydropterin synthase
VSTEQSSAERLYTLEDAQRELAQRECVLHGHNFDVIVKLGSADPHLVICMRCGRSWGIVTPSGDDRG